MSASQSTPRKRTADENWVYFCENACLTSFSGCVDEDSTMTEREISEYIWHSNPELHEKLNRVRLPSSYLASDEIEHTAGRQTVPAERILSSFLDHAGRAEGTKFHSVNNAQLPSGENSGEDHATEFVLDRYRFNLHQHSDPETIYCCSYPTCRNPLNVIPLGECYGSVTDEAWNKNNNLLTEYPRMVYYCFDCLQEVLKQKFEVEMVHQKLPQLVDGTRDREMVLESAEKIHPLLQAKELKFMYFPEEPPLTPGKDSNSKKGNRLRRQKQYEIERILEALTEKYLRKREYMRGGQDTDSISSELQIQPRRDVSPFRDRYKKQGLEYCELHNQFGSGEILEENEAATSKFVGDSGDESVLNCFCREPPDEEGMIRCSAITCMFGAVHLRCSGLKDVATIPEEFICKYCKGHDAACSENDCSDDTVQKRDLGWWKKCSPLDCNSIRDGITWKNGMDTDNESEERDEDAAADLGPVGEHPSGFIAVNSPPPRACDEINCTLQFACENRFVGKGASSKE
ncbi:hypothetical protein A1O3_03183 [Capronia epimyces CBS 606.96]|uniref:Zinc finger PHD-type domain-containing protein n=1 Tax=Capronia epimyces CBS 606.96 TaxID=1182542 RepID=W9Z6I7_9EURO|nr:uncharacterized protein A1O3_03183 [Capronia epimyces CBS 606.96]EXJ90114.1 hypothetical protein A1O3_03183 [Capronia epimyces CBS 606.96]